MVLTDQWFNVAEDIILYRACLKVPAFMRMGGGGGGGGE